MHAESTHWTRDSRLGHFNDARIICREFGTIGDRSASEARRLAAAKTVAAVIQLARADQSIVVLPEAFVVERIALNNPAGIVDLRDGSIRPYVREYLTKRTAVAPLFEAP